MFVGAHDAEVFHGFTEKYISAGTENGNIITRINILLMQLFLIYSSPTNGFLLLSSMAQYCSQLSSKSSFQVS